jgi:fluoride exporter
VPSDPDPIERLPIDPDVVPNDPAEPALAHGQATRPPARPGRADPAVLGAVALGGALGAPARFGVAQIIHVAPDSFPWATFWTNISGSFALGLILVLILQHFPPTRYLRPFVTTGFLGAYTTYSTFAVETDLLVKNGHTAIGIGYAAASLAAGFAAVWGGIWAARTAPRLGQRGRI